MNKSTIMSAILHFALIYLWLFQCCKSNNEESYDSLTKKPNCEPLNEFVRCFEITTIDSVVYIHEIIEMKVTVFGEQFDIVLLSSTRTGYNVFPRYLNVTIVTNSGKQTSAHRIIDRYTGFVKGRTEDTSVHGRFDGVLFDGVIRTANETYHFEPKSKFFNTSGKGNNHMVVYRLKDVRFIRQKHRSKSDHSVHVALNKTEVFDINSPFARNNSNKFVFRSNPSRKRRNVFHSEIRKTCNVHAVVDHTFLTEVARGSINSAISEVIYHITESDRIFRSTDFNGDSFGDNIGFMVTHLTVYENMNVADYYMNTVTDSVDDVLDQFSRYDFDHVCLAILFTHREFGDGIIGLAWIASSSYYDYPGGLCQTRIEYDSAEAYNFNTLLVSSLNYGNVVPKRVTSLTVAHEFGHAFGATHDVPTSSFCAPGGVEGHFIMHPHSSDADKPNNDNFSPCSKMKMAPVIANKGVLCLEITEGMVCGNEIVEPGEECDCGYSYQCDFVDKCCNPATNDDLQPLGCQLRNETGIVCSPKASECCTTNCSIKSSLAICREATECSSEVHCTGIDTNCPRASFIPDGTPCFHSQKVCQNGECSVSVCAVHGLNECQCMSAQSKRCMLCCQNGTDPNTCEPAARFGIYNSNGDDIHLVAGQSCSNYTGICNQNNTCVIAMSIRILEKLDILLKDSIFSQILDVLRNYWYLIFIACLTSLSLVIITRYIIRKTNPRRFLNKKRDYLITLQLQAGDEYRKLSAQLAKLSSQKEACLQEFVTTYEVDSIVTIGRLCTFFPMATRSEISSLTFECENEEIAVKTMLNNGYAMRQLFDESENNFCDRDISNRFNNSQTTSSCDDLNNNCSKFELSVFGRSNPSYDSENLVNDDLVSQLETPVRKLKFGRF